MESAQSVASDEGRDRDFEAVKRRCQPLQVGYALILLMNLAVTFNMLTIPSEYPQVKLVSLAILYISSMLAVFMMFSLCARGSHTAAWVSVLLSPLVIGLFSLQLEAIIGYFLMPLA